MSGCQQHSLDEIIFFRHPGSAAHVMLFDLPLPPRDVSDAQLAQIASQYGLLHSATVIAQARDAHDSDEQEQADDASMELQPQRDTQPPPVSQPSVSSTAPCDPPTLPPPACHPPASSPSQPSHAAASPVSSMYAHLNFYSASEAQSARKALHRSAIVGSRVRAILAQPRAPTLAPDGRRYPISFNRCVELMNHFVGYGKWSCGIQWLKAYSADEHADIVAGQTAGSATERELQAFSIAASRSFPCSFACEVEVSVADRPTRDGRSVISGLQVGSQAVSHSEAAEGQNREQAMKRAVTNAYLQLFSHLALIRTKTGDVYVRDLG